MTAKSVILQDHTREQLKTLAPSALAVVPLGATEQHGPHLPVGTDHFIVEHLARKAAQSLRGRHLVLVAPALPFGCSDHHLPFGGTVSISTTVYYQVVCDLLRSLVTDGFRSVFLLNGHGGNHELIQLAARDIALQLPVQVAAASYWTLAWDSLLRLNAHQGARLPGHAGRFETSVILSIAPNLVETDRPRREPQGTDPKAPYTGYRAERHGYWQSINGFSDSPADATPQLGESYLVVMIEEVANAFAAFHESCGVNA